MVLVFWLQRYERGKLLLYRKFYCVFVSCFYLFWPQYFAGSSYSQCLAPIITNIFPEICSINTCEKAGSRICVFVHRHWESEVMESVGA